MLWMICNVRGEQIPEPIADKNYSGKFIIRIPPEIHRKLAIEAAEAGVSLNRLASAKVTSCIELLNQWLKKYSKMED